jgi:hypothetical protein
MMKQYWVRLLLIVPIFHQDVHAKLILVQIIMDKMEQPAKFQAVAGLELPAEAVNKSSNWENGMQAKENAFNATSRIIIRRL